MAHCPANRSGPRGGHSRQSGRDGMLIKLSKTLSYVLRHGAAKMGLSIQRGGFLYVDDLLNLDQLKRFTENDVLNVVENNDKKRFHVERDENTGQLKIRANQGHSMEVEELDLTPITDPHQFAEVVHGTYRKHWSAIKSEGLKTMGRTHIHLAPGEPGADQVISGMRGSCDAIIHIDIRAALADGLKFFMSANGVILSSGNEVGVILPKYFIKAIDRKNRTELPF